MADSKDVARSKLDYSYLVSLTNEFHFFLFFFCIIFQFN